MMNAFAIIGIAYITFSYLLIGFGAGYEIKSFGLHNVDKLFLSVSFIFSPITVLWLAAMRIGDMGLFDDWGV